MQAIYFADEVVGVVDVNGDAEEGQGEGSQGEGGSCTFFETNTFEMVLRGGRWLIQNQQLEIVVCFLYFLCLLLFLSSFKSVESDCLLTRRWVILIFHPFQAKIGNYSLVPDNDAITTTCAPFESST